MTTTTSNSNNDDAKLQPQPPAQKTEEPSSNSKKDKIDSRVYPIALSSLLMGSAIGIVMPLLPALSGQLNLSHAEFGLVISLMGFTRLVVNIPAAYVAERWGRRFSLVGGPLISASSMVQTAIASTLNELLVARFFTGVGGSLQMAAAQLYLSDISVPANRARTIAPMMIGFSIGATLGPALGGFLADYSGSLQFPFYFVSGCMLAASLNNTRLPETRSLEAMKLQKNRTVSEELKNTIGQWKPLLASKDIQAILLLHGTYWAVMSGCLFSLMPIYAAETFTLTPGGIGGIFALSSLTSAILTQPFAWMSDKLGRKRSILPATILLTSALIFIPFTTEFYPFLGVVGMWATGASLLGSTPTAYVADITTVESRAQALALLRSAGDAGLMIGAGTIGLLADASSMQTAFLLSSTLIAGAGTHFLIRAKESNVVLQTNKTSNEEKKKLSRENSFTHGK